METLHINDIPGMSRVKVINALALYVPDNTYKRVDFLKMETEVLKDLLTCYLNPRAKLPAKSKTVIMRLAEPVKQTKKVAVKKVTKRK
jgi:hypothetical protein